MFPKQLPATILAATALLTAPALQAQTWSISMDLLPARSNHVATSAGGKALFAGGADAASGPHSAVNILDVASGTWSDADLSVARFRLVDEEADLVASLAPDHLAAPGDFGHRRAFGDHRHLGLQRVAG